MHGRRGMLHVALEFLQTHGLTDVERRKLAGRSLGEQFGREPARQLVARRGQASVAAVVDDSTAGAGATAALLLLLATMLAVM